MFIHENVGGHLSDFEIVKLIHSYIGDYETHDIHRVLASVAMNEDVLISTLYLLLPKAVVPVTVWEEMTNEGIKPLIHKPIWRINAEYLGEERENRAVHNRLLNVLEVEKAYV